VFDALQLKVGSISTVIHVSLLLLAINTWAYTFFGLEHFPDWALNVDSIIRQASLGNGTNPLLNTTAAGIGLQVTSVVY